MPLDGSNRCISRVDRDCVDRIYRAYAVAMAWLSPRPQAGWKQARRRERREERREQMATSSIHCICLLYTSPSPRDRQRSRNEAARWGTDPFLHRTAAKARWINGSNRFILRVDRDCVDRIHCAYAVAMALPSPRPQAGWKQAGRREKREERREQMAASSIHCIFTVSRDHLEKVLKIRGGHPARFTAFLRCPVTTSKSSQK